MHDVDLVETKIIDNKKVGIEITRAVQLEKGLIGIRIYLIMF